MTDSNANASQSKISISLGTSQRNQRVERVTFATLDELVGILRAHPSSAQGGAYILPCTMRGDVRRKDNAEASRIIGLDFDKLTAEQAEALTDAARQFDCLLFPTRSSTVRAPRLRLLVLTKAPVAANDYRAAHDTLAAMLREATGDDGIVADPSCNKPEQPLFTPVAGTKITVNRGARLNGAWRSSGDEESEPAQRGSPLIDEENRNVSLASWAGRFRNWGLNYEQMLKQLRALNESITKPLPDKEVRTIARSYTRYDRGGEELQEITITHQEEKAEPVREPLIVPDGLVAEIAHWSAQRAYVVGPQFDLAAGLICTALATQNRYLVQGWKTPLQPYIMVLAPTGGGKDSTHQSVAEFARRLRDPNSPNLEDSLFQGFQSYHSLLDTLAVEPSMACWMWDEAARKLKSAGRSAGSPDYQILTHLLGMYGRAASSIAGLPGRNTPVTRIDRPFLTVLASAQPSQMVEAVTETEFATGLIARFLLLDAGDEITAVNKMREAIFPSSINKAVRAIREAHLNGSGFCEITYTSNSIYTRMEDYQLYAREQMKAGDLEATLWTRAHQNALIVAGLLAVGRNGRRPQMDRAVVDYAIALSTRSVEDWIKRLGSSAAGGTRYEKLALKLLEYISNPKLLISAAMKGRPKERSLLLAGYTPRSVLVRRVGRHNELRDIDWALKTLQEGEQVIKGTHDGYETYAKGR